MEVFLVHVGCRYEGGKTRVVCQTEELARRWVKHYIAREKRSHPRSRGRFHFRYKWLESFPNRWFEFHREVSDPHYREGSDVIYIKRVRCF